SVDVHRPDLEFAGNGLIEARHIEQIVYELFEAFSLAGNDVQVTLAIRLDLDFTQQIQAQLDRGKRSLKIVRDIAHKPLEQVDSFAFHGQIKLMLLGVGAFADVNRHHDKAIDCARRIV